MVYLIRNQVDLDKASRTNITKRVPFLEYTRTGDGYQYGWQRAMNLPNPRTLKSHLPYQFYGDSVLENGGKIIYIMRNPKDTAVSSFHFYHGLTTSDELKALTIQKFIKLFFETGNLSYGSVFDHFTSFWSQRSKPNILIVFYEDLLRDKPTEIRKIAKFLNVVLNDEQVKVIVDATSFSTMAVKESTRNTKQEEDEGTVSSGYKFYRKGEIGDWKNYFTVAESKMANGIIKRRLNAQGLYFHYG